MARARARPCPNQTAANRRRWSPRPRRRARSVPARQMRAMLTTGTPRHPGTTGVAGTTLRELGPLDALGAAAALPFVHRVDGRLNARTTPKYLSDHPWLRPVSDHYIDFINPVLRSLKAGAWGAREWMLLDFSRAIRVFFRWLLGGYLGFAISYLLRRKCRAEAHFVLARQHIIFRREAAATP